MSDGANDKRAPPVSIQRAERELADLRREIGHHEAQIANKRDRSLKLEHYIEMSREFGAESGTPRRPESTDQTEGRRPPPTRGKWSRIMVECVSILRERNEPTSARELVPLLAERGVRIDTKHPDRALAQYLSREPGIVGDHARGNVGQGWFLKEWGDRYDITRDAATEPTPPQPQPWQSEAAE
jgi:hypothetical protein